LKSERERAIATERERQMQRERNRQKERAFVCERVRVRG